MPDMERYLFCIAQSLKFAAIEASKNKLTNSY
jgi:hypothetical protein